MHTVQPNRRYAQQSTNTARGEPALHEEIAAEMASADSVDLLCAFVKWTGLRLLLDPISELLDDGRQLRVLTTTYVGATERRALDELVRLGADVRVSYLEDILLERALQQLRIPHSLLVFPGEGHSLEKDPWHGYIKVREELQWLEKYGGQK